MTDRIIPDPRLTESEASAFARAMKHLTLTTEVASVVEKIGRASSTLSPKFPEPKHAGAVVMTDDGLFVRITSRDGKWQAVGVDHGIYIGHEWSDLNNPRTLTTNQHAEHNIPVALPDLEDPALVGLVAEAIYVASASTRRQSRVAAQDALAIVKTGVR